MKLEQLKYIYFLGIGGIGMSALARWFHAKGYSVSGYDKTPTPLTNALQQEGIAVHFEDIPANIPSEILLHPDKSLVVLTPAIPADNQELNYLKQYNLPIKKRSEVLGIITALRYTVAVAGTHGKTTTSSVVAHLLHHAGVSCSAFLGGISVNLNSNLLLHKGKEEGDVVVVEADEFDRSFLTLHPNIAIVTSADADHLDIYGDKSALTASFQDFISQIQPNGFLIIHEELADELTQKMDPSVTVYTYAFDKGELKASNLKVKEHRFHFDINSPLGNLQDVELA
ncbi:MAG: Mur ligase domain-containing protein, partial [Hymenobacteraceae bacterium]|nr:Mur ligase domain-containing protein [Hymenobacteraceae bacterium]MDX5397446.1 Mur ligase domain-containing protein [Hymenobacteraceae bacterium]MDX5513524.1 Mur ligase domain-containing protein [Hymenobacteraceae bacterium]